MGSRVAGLAFVKKIGLNYDMPGCKKVYMAKPKATKSKAIPALKPFDTHSGLKTSHASNIQGWPKWMA